MKRIIEIRAAEGGEDARQFAHELSRAYQRMLLRVGWKHRLLDDLRIEVEHADCALLENEAGGHRVQRVPFNERRGRVHTSTVTVAVIDPSVVVDRVRESDLRVEWFSGSGAGGQHRNKHQNSCRLTHVPTGTTRKAETRSRESSYRDALAALTRALDEEAEQRAARGTNGLRRSQVGSGMRGDKRRTYRFQEDSVTDHVTGMTSRCETVMRGNFEKLWRASCSR